MCRCMYVYMCSCTCIYRWICMHIICLALIRQDADVKVGPLYVCMSVCMDVCMNECLCVCAHICIYTYIDIHILVASRSSARTPTSIRAHQEPHGPLDI